MCMGVDGRRDLNASWLFVEQLLSKGSAIMLESSLLEPFGLSRSP